MNHGHTPLRILISSLFYRRPDAGGGDGGSGGTAGTGEGEKKTFTQDQLEEIVEKRLVRDRKKQAETYGDLEQLKKDADELAELKKRDQSEVERLQSDLDKANAKLAEETQRADSAEAARKQDRIDNALRAHASEKGAVDADAVLALLPKDAREKVTVGDDGQVTGHEAAVDALLESKQYLVGSSGSAPGTPREAVDGGIRTPAPSADLDRLDDPKAVLDAVSKLGS